MQFVEIPQVADETPYEKHERDHWNERNCDSQREREDDVLQQQQCAEVAADPQRSRQQRDLARLRFA